MNLFSLPASLSPAETGGSGLGTHERHLCFKFLFILFFLNSGT